MDTEALLSQHPGIAQFLAAGTPSSQIEEVFASPIGQELKLNLEDEIVNDPTQTPPSTGRGR